MGIAVDIVIIAIILLSTFLAYRKGLVKLAIQLFSFVIAIVVTFILYIPISNFVINATAIDETIENAIYEKANDIMVESEGSNELANQVVDTAKNEMLPETARTLAINIVRGGIIIILFIGLKIALRFVTALADLIAKLPIIEQINQLGGLVYGILRGIIIIYACLLILSVSGQIIPENQINQGVEQSYIGKVMYENNILKVFFK